MVSTTIYRSRFQGYGLVALLMAASALTGALAAIYVQPIALSEPVSVAAPVAPAAPAAERPNLIQLNTVSTSSERDEIWQDKQAFLQSQRPAVTSALTPNTRAADEKMAFEREVLELKQSLRGKGVMPVVAVSEAFADRPARSQGYFQLKVQQLEIFER